MAVHTYEHGETWRPPDPLDDPVVDDRTPRPDRIRWGAVWAGLVTAISVFALLQLTFFATDAVSLDVNPTEGETTLPFWSALAAAVGFLLGGLVTGASSRWRRISDGVLQGVVLWAVTTLALLLASGVAAGALTSQLGGTFGRLADLRDELADSGSLSDAQVADARDAAAAAVLLLGIMFVATIIGSIIGTKMWPHRPGTQRHDDERLGWERDAGPQRGGADRTTVIGRGSAWDDDDLVRHEERVVDSDPLPPTRRIETQDHLRDRR